MIPIENTMIPIENILAVVFATVLGVALVWVLVCLILRASNFAKDGKRHQTRHEKDDKRRSEVIEYHNNAIYRAFEFYIKITLAMLGGMAYVVISDGVSARDVAPKLLDVGSLFLIGAALVCSVAIFTHQKSKIERWSTRFAWWEPLLWVEFSFIAAMMSVSIVFRRVVFPALTNNTLN